MKRIKRLLSMFLCCVMMLSLMPATTFAEDDNFSSFKGAQGSTLNHIDVRVAGSLTLESKVNGDVISSETIAVTVSNVSATLNGKSVTFKKKSGTGKENEWRADGLSLNKEKDVVVLTCNVSGTKKDGTKINLPVSMTYQGEGVLQKFISACPNHTGYDIDVVAKDLEESFTVNADVEKIWADNNDQYEKRPDSIQVQMYADGEKYGSPVTLNAANGWKASYKNMPKYSSGTKEISYSVEEVSVPDGYTVSVNGFTITNTYNVPIKTSVDVSKEWNDDSNRDGIRPKSVTVKLLADGEDTDKTLVLNEANNWTGSFTGLDKYAADKEIVYTIKEVEVDKYETSITGDAKKGFTITNTHTPAKYEKISVEKKWEDSNNQDGIRPATVNVTLTGKVGNDVVSTNEVELGKDGKWSHVFENLPVKSGGQDIVYSVTEDKVPDKYTVSYSGNIKDGFTITNTHTPEKINVSGSKEWNDKGDQDGKRPESITVNLMANGEKVASKVVTADDNWSWTFDNQYKFENGKEITYTFTEESVADYSVDYSKANTIKNSYTPQQTSVSVTKAWEDDSNRDGIRPESVTVKLLADGKPTGKTLELSEDNQWTGAFTELDMYKNHGTLIKYTVEEKDTASGYEPSIVKAENGNIFTITNTHTPERISVSGTKTWNDAGNQDGIRPESITVNLMANGEKVASKVVTADDNWSWTFDNQYKFENGKEIVYSVTEDPIDGYTCKVDGMNITNTHEPEMTQITIGKTWVGDNASNRPDAIKVNVFADGMYLTTVDVTAQGNWTYTLTDLPKYKAGEVGKEIVYTISEKEVPGYKSSVDGYNITNTYVPGEVPPQEDTPSQGGVPPQTGDDFNIGLYMMMLLLALTGIGASVIRRKRVN